MRMLQYLILLVVALGLAWWLVHVFAHNSHSAAPPAPAPVATPVALVQPPAPLHGRVRVNVRDAFGAYPAQSQTDILNGEDSLVFSNVAI